MDGLNLQKPITTSDISSVLAGYGASQADQAAILAPGRRSLSYAALCAQQQYVHNSFAEWGLHRGDPVAVLLPEGPELAAAIAVLPVSATVVPVGPDLSVDDYERLFQRCSVKALILPHGQRHAAREAADRAGLFQIDLVADPESPAGTFELIAVTSMKQGDDGGALGSEIAYILGTSGTTTDRKLVPNTNNHILSYANAMKNWFGFEPGDLNLHVMPTHFAHGITISLMVPLLNGASVVCLPGYQANTFFPLMDEYRPTWLSAAFTIYRDILRHADEYQEIVSNTRLRFMRSGAGRLENDEIERLEQAFNTPLIVGLSCTESLSVTHNPLPPQRRKIGSVGVPVGNEVRLRDENGRFVDVGEEGEIVARGPLVFHGYLDDPMATDEAFLDGWYRTGDLGKFDEDGFLYLTGRIKEIINCGGEKISPAEIDRVLALHPAVAEGAAFALPHPTLGELVVAAVVPVPGLDPDERGIRRHVRSHLAASKTPSKIFFVDHLPRTETGKIQRHKLMESLSD